MKFKWRKWNRVVHRDFGYLFFGMTIIYAISGIGMNHLSKEWDPRVGVDQKEIQVEMNGEINKEKVLNVLEQIGEEDNYKNHFFPNENYLKVFLRDKGEVLINLSSGAGTYERKKTRPILNETVWLHYDPVKWWTWFSDIYCGALILLALSGLFIIRGKQGITGRGAWMTIVGILIPIVFLLIYFYK